MVSSSNSPAVLPSSAKQQKINHIFAQVAPRYDVMNDLMSGGLHRLWKDVFVSHLHLGQNQTYHHLDVASGTGDIALRVARHLSAFSTLKVVDIQAPMLDLCRTRLNAAALPPEIHYIQADAEQLPWPDKIFDAYTIAFGIRNVPNREQGLREAWRVLKQGGQFLCLEFSACRSEFIQKLFNMYSSSVIPKLGKLIVGDSAPYEYLVDSIRHFPSADLFAHQLHQAGFRSVRYHQLSGGIVAIHSGWKI